MILCFILLLIIFCSFFIGLARSRLINLAVMLEDDIIEVSGGFPPVTAPQSMGYLFQGSTIVAYDYSAGSFFLASGGRVEFVTAMEKGFDPPQSLKAPLFPSLGKYATCWLGDCIITSIDGRRALIRTTCGKYAIAPYLLKAISMTCTLRGVRLLYGNNRCAFFPSVSCSGGAVALLEELTQRMTLAGLSFRGDISLMEMQSPEGPAIALRHITEQKTLLLRLRGTVEGTVAPGISNFLDQSEESGLAHVIVEDYLRGNPWAMPISLELLCARLGLSIDIDPTFISGPITSVDDCLFLEAPQRAFSMPCWEINAEQLVLGVRAGRLEPQRDGTFAMPYAHGGWGQVKARGIDMQKLMWKLDDLYDLCLPLGIHRVDLPGCPDCLLLERFGPQAYDPTTRTIRSTL